MLIVWPYQISSICIVGLCCRISNINDLGLVELDGSGIISVNYLPDIRFIAKWLAVTGICSVKLTLFEMYLF
jgi:hypothetical protein